MTIFNNTLTKEEVSKLMNAKDGMNYPETEHNRKAIAEAIHNQLRKLQGK